MARALRPLVDQMMGGKLDRRLQAWRDEGLSFASIAGLIEQATGVHLTAEAIRRWCRTLPTVVLYDEGGEFLKAYRGER